MDIITRFYINYEYGYHRATIEVSDMDYYKVINELSREFETKVENEEENGKLYTWHYIINYYGDEHLVGFIIEEEKR